MASFVSKRPVRVTVEERPEEWIEIKSKLSVGERGRLTDAIVAISGGAGSETEITMHAGRYLGAMLEVGVVGWRLLDEDSKEVPFRRELIVELDPDDPLVDKALQEITARNPTLGRGERTAG